MNKDYGNILGSLKSERTLELRDGFDFMDILSLFPQFALFVFSSYISYNTPLQWLAIFFSLATVIIFIFILIEMYGKFWISYTLSYAYTDKGIIYNWRSFGTKELFIPYDNIQSISFVEDSKLKKLSIFFQNVSGVSILTHHFLTNFSIGLLCFNQLNIEEGKNAYKLLSQHIHESDFKEVDKKGKWNDLLRYSRTIPITKLLMFHFILGAITMIAGIIDGKYLNYNLLEEKVVDQKWIAPDEYAVASKIWTENNYSFKTSSTKKFENKMLTIGVTPIFGSVVYYAIDKKDQSDKLQNGLKGIALGIRYFTIFCLLFAGFYFAYKRGHIETSEIVFFTAIPIILVLVVYYVL